MGSEGSGDRVSQQRGGGTNSVSGVTMCSESMLYGSNWDPIMSLSGNFGNSNMDSTEFANPLMLENQTRVSPLAQFQSDSVLDLVPRIPSFGSGSFSEMIPSFGQKDHCRNPENGILASSPYGKRKREEASKGASPNKNGEEEQQKDPSGDTSEFPKEDDEKKQKNTRGKQVAKQEKENSGGAELSKDNYIHVRARRGQATNSHSLAERVRRERISERMKLLQELVPGCNKITGKAMMLDEIINYVQSLQQQVEFLSMKLATVNPEINMDIDRILSKDILHLQSNASLLGINRSSLPFPGYPQANFPNGPSTTTPLHSLPQHIWNNELQSLLQMGFEPDPSVSMGPNGP